jgi:hypothetical protein
MSACGLLFQWPSTINKILKLSVLVYYKSDVVISNYKVTCSRHDMAVWQDRSSNPRYTTPKTRPLAITSPLVHLITHWQLNMLAFYFLSVVSYTCICDLFSPWYGWTTAHCALNNNYSLKQCVFTKDSNVTKTKYMTCNTLSLKLVAMI